jgi:putative redox protein
MVTITIERTHADYGFDAADQQGHVVRMDTSDDHGGDNYGARPMQTLLMGLGGCSGIDVVSILKKQRQQLHGFKMVITAQREENKVPALWEKAHIVFHLSGNIDIEKAKNAAALSIDKYCSVAETLRRAGCTITWEVSLS